MRKIILTLAIAFLLIGTVSAQNWGNWGNWNTPPETVNLEGTLQFQNGQIVLSSGENVYYIPRIRQLVGFVDGLREGARISVDAYVFGNFLHITKLTLGNRSYDFPAPAFTQGNRMAPGMNPGPMGNFFGPRQSPGADPRQAPRQTPRQAPRQSDPGPGRFNDYRNHHRGRW